MAHEMGFLSCYRGECKMTKDQIMELIKEEVSVDIYGDIYGHDRVAEVIEAAISRSNTAGYFRAMKDIQTGELEQINNL
jgi:hypothetical protein